MNKALHVFVYLFLILAGVALYLEIQLNENRMVLSARNRQQEDYLVKLAATIESEKPDTSATAELKKDISSIEAKPVHIPATEDVLDGYRAYLEQTELKTYNWNTEAIRSQLRRIYEIDPETGKPRLDGGMPVTESPQTSKFLLDQLYAACQDQQKRLNDTREELKKLHGKLDSAVEEINKLKPEGRQREMTIAQRDETIKKLEGEKEELVNETARLTHEVQTRENEISSLTEQNNNLVGELDATKGELEDANKEIERNKKLLQELQKQIALGGGRTTVGLAVSSIPTGDKGKVISADNESMFAIVEFTPEAMVQLKGEDGSRPLPLMEFGVKRPGFNGEAGEFVGRIRLRQEVTGKNYIVCDILTNWEQDKLQPNDIIFAD